MSAEVTLSEVPKDSRLHQYITPGDFVDCYRVDSNLGVREVAEIIVQYPSWVETLMMLRKFVTQPFGLINEHDGASETIGIFPIESETNEEILAGFDDKHLDFRISVTAKHGVVHFATWVKTHNLGGKLYLKLVTPFHVVICRNALQRVAAYERK